MRLPRCLHPKHSRGQALVEMALVLPLLVLLLVMAIDFGRVFFGHVALENAARIGADFAAGHADAWNGVPDSDEQDDLDLYKRQIAQDLQSLNCQLAGDPSDPVEDRVPSPDFDVDGDGVDEFGDSSLVKVELDCAFELLTPLAEAALGGPMTLHADAQFVINHTITSGLAGGGPPPPPPGCQATEGTVPHMVGEKMQNAKALWIAAGFTGPFLPAVTNSNKNKIVRTQSLSDGACALLTSSVTVTHS